VFTLLAIAEFLVPGCYISRLCVWSDKSPETAQHTAMPSILNISLKMRRMP